MSYGKILSCILAGMLTFCSCDDLFISYKIRKFENKEFVLPPTILSISSEGRKIDTLHYNGMKFVVYFDSTRCVSCNLHKLINLMPFVERIDSAWACETFIAFEPAANQETELAYEIEAYELPVKIYVDSEHKIRESNRIPSDDIFCYFLVGEDGKPVLLGNPLSSRNLLDLYEKALRENCAGQQQF